MVGSGRYRNGLANTAYAWCDIWFKAALSTGNSAVSAVDQGSKVFTTTTGDQTGNVEAGDRLRVTGSTGNDGFYTAVSAVLDGGDTNVTVSEAIPDTTADGSLYWGNKSILDYLVSVHSGEPLPDPVDEDGVPMSKPRLYQPVDS